MGKWLVYSACAVVVGGAVATTSGATVPFTESFSVDSANWMDIASSPVAWIASGGAQDGGGYISVDFNFVDSTAEDTPALFRAQDEFGSSGGAFEGDWIGDGVGRFSVFVRHNAGVPLSFYIRFTPVVNFPGALWPSPPPIGPPMAPVPSGEWTELSFAVSAENPSIWFPEGAGNFASVFGGVGHVQIGVVPPVDLVGVDQAVTFDVDTVSISSGAVPTVSEWGMAVMTLLVLSVGSVAFRRSNPRLAGGVEA